MTIAPEIKEKNIHAPDEKLTEYMSENAYLLRKKEELDLRMETKKKLSKKDLEELQHIESRSKTLANTKRRILDYIVFPAMANLTFFFDAIRRHPELKHVFYSDIMDLLGVRRLNPKPGLLGGNYAFMFEDLVASMLDLASTDNDYTIKLIHMLQRYIQLKLYGPEILGTFDTTRLVYHDIGRALAWTELLALRVKENYDFIKSPSRTFSYDTKELMEWKS